MPGKDGTGPAGQGNYRGRMSGYSREGPGGSCVCPKCGTIVKHNRAEPCITIRCPKFDALMVRA